MSNDRLAPGLAALLARASGVTESVERLGQLADCGDYDEGASSVMREAADDLEVLADAVIRLIHDNRLMSDAVIRLSKRVTDQDHDHTSDALSNVDGDPTRPTIRLYPTGVYFTPFQPDPAHLDPRCIAHGLAATNRYNGHTASLVNVAHHSVITSLYAEAVFAAHRPDAPRAEVALVGLDALFHDGSEGVSGFGDVTGPVKRHPLVREALEQVEGVINGALAARYGLSKGFATHPRVKEADAWAFHWENRDLRGIDPPSGVLLPTETLKPLGFEESRHLFLAHYLDLTGAEVGEVPWRPVMPPGLDGQARYRAPIVDAWHRYLDEMWVTMRFLAREGSR